MVGIADEPKEYTPSEIFQPYGKDITSAGLRLLPKWLKLRAYTTRKGLVVLTLASLCSGPLRL